MQLLRDNKDTLMSVLDAFVHDPLVEWEDKKRELVGTSTIPTLIYAYDVNRNARPSDGTQSETRLIANTIRKTAQP